MKTYSGERPQSKLNLGNGNWHVYMDAHEVERHQDAEGHDVTVMVWESEYVEVSGRPTYPKVVEALVRERYSVSDEFAVHRQKELKYEQFVEYNQYVEHCKAIARPVFFPDEEEGGE